MTAASRRRSWRHPAAIRPKLVIASDWVTVRSYRLIIDFFNRLSFGLGLIIKYVSEDEDEI